MLFRSFVRATGFAELEYRDQRSVVFGNQSQQATALDEIVDSLAAPDPQQLPGLPYLQQRQLTSWYSHSYPFLRVFL